MPNTLGARWAAALLLALPFLQGCADPGQPNVLLITLDTVRADHLSSYGYAKPISPQLDAFAPLLGEWDGTGTSPGATRAIG